MEQSRVALALRPTRHILSQSRNEHFNCSAVADFWASLSTKDFSSAARVAALRSVLLFLSEGPSVLVI